MIDDDPTWWKALRYAFAGGCFFVAFLWALCFAGACLTGDTNAEVPWFLACIGSILIGSVVLP